MVQFIDGDDIVLKTGKTIYQMPFDRPYDWAKAGESVVIQSNRSQRAS
jgi:glycerophosphoryl diester phosphodiesterase